MRILPLIGILALTASLIGCDKSEKPAAAQQPQEATVLDREFEIPPVAKGAEMYTVTEHGGQLIGEVTVTKGDATLDVRVAVDNKTVFEDNAVRRTTIDVKLPPGELLIEIGRHTDATDPLSVSEKFKIRRAS